MFWYIFGAYLFISILTFFFPSILHKKKPRWNKPGKFQHWLIGHRGGSMEKPENTIDAFQNSVNNGSDMLELDVWMTLDGVVVVSHDNNLLRVTGKDVNITDCTLNELPNLQSTIYTHFSTTPMESFDKAYKIATLEEVFERFDEQYVSIDIKRASPETVQAVKDLILKYNRQDRTMVGNGQKKPNDYINSQIDSITFMSAPRVFTLYFLYMIGLAGIFTVREDVISVPLATQIYKTLKQREMSPFKGLLQQVLLSYNLVRFLIFISKGLFWHLKQRGVVVFVWVLNSKEDFQYAVNLGVDGIMTDYPSLLNEFYSELEGI